MIQNARDVLKGRAKDNLPVVKLFSISGSAIWLLSDLIRLSLTLPLAYAIWARRA
nr:DUF2958 domain-containing protein [Runella zeae]